MDSKSYMWQSPEWSAQTPESVSGEIAIVELPVKVVFEWSDQIVADVDDEGNPVEYESGFIMKVIPDQGFVYCNHARQTIAHAFKEKS